MALCNCLVPKEADSGQIVGLGYSFVPKEADSGQKA
jgi:hypothetical protein